MGDGCRSGWSQRMATLGTAITEAIIHDYGASAFLSRLSDPFWFQALGAVMGMDWHSSGITTSVMGALKRGLAEKADELGLYICGGRGRFSRNTPSELRPISDRRGFDGDALVRTSRLTARIDNNAIADGFQIYLHSFVLAANGEWAVVQQGLNDRTGMARRYHWHSASVQDFVAEPHTAIVGDVSGNDHESRRCQGSAGAESNDGNLARACRNRLSAKMSASGNRKTHRLVAATRHLRLPASS